MKRRGLWIAMVLALVAGAIVLLLPVGGIKDVRMSVIEHAVRAKALDLSGYPDGAPERPVHLLFMHHSCGGQLLAAPGLAVGANSIHSTHPNGGGLRTRLEKASYVVHEASYGSRIGQATDIFDWPPKFRDQMSDMLACDSQDLRHANGRRNQIVVFKSCYPNNAFRSDGQAPGNPEGPDLTVWNAKAAYTALLPEFAKHPDVLFVCVTAPPLAPKTAPQPLWRQIVKKALGRAYDPVEAGRLAREFNNWLVDQAGWLKNSTLTNVVVFDYYDILTGEGAANLSVYPTGDGFDSHPSSAGNQRAAEAFERLLNRAVRRAGMIP
jgi:hypothetical protein